MDTDGRCHVIHYRVNGGRWYHGKTIPSWAATDADHRLHQTSAVHIDVRNAHPGERVRIQHRVLPEDEGWALLAWNAQDKLTPEARAQLWRRPVPPALQPWEGR